MYIFSLKTIHRLGAVLLLWAFVVSAAWAQTSKETFVISANGDASDLNAYSMALKAIDLTSYRRPDERRILRFNTGVEVQLLSARELLMLGIPVEGTRLDRTGGSPVSPSLFFLHPSGVLIEQVPTVEPEDPSILENPRQ